MYQAILIRSDFAHLSNVDIHFIIANRIGLMGCYQIGQVHLTVLHHFDGINLRLEIPHIIHLLPQLLHADLR